LVGGADIAGGKQPVGAAVEIGAEGVADGRHAASFLFFIFFVVTRLHATLGSEPPRAT
jgi:hypothetical protein